MERALTIAELILLDSAVKCSTNVSRDLQTIKRRFSHEGLSFLTITLPNYLEQLFCCLENGEVTSGSFPGWKKNKHLPAFLQGFVSLVFDINTGGILNEPSTQAIACVRQICSTFKKVKLECTKEKVTKAFNDFLRIDSGMHEHPSVPEARLLQTFDEVAATLWSTVFGEAVNLDDLIPKHGPGATADKITGNKKYLPDHVWPKRLDASFSLGNTVFNTEESYNASVDSENYRIKRVEEADELPVRVISVPKTLKAPRIIALEPVYMQMTQQSVKDYVVQKIESCPLTRGHVNFSDQKINRVLAIINSKSLCMATLDLSAASDRVHKWYVHRMLRVHPRLRDLVFTTRSQRAMVDVDGTQSIISLNKFASMGSALCFPIEAMFFTTCVVVARLQHSDTPATFGAIKRAMSGVFVYGDDIIIPTAEVDTVVDVLQKFGNVVSLGKSFWKGRFRESCGMDAYDGIEITPTYMRNPLPNRKSDVSAIISNVATANQLYERGFCLTAQFLVSEIERITGVLPQVGTDCEGIGWTFETTGAVKTRYNRKLQKLEVKSYVRKQVKKKDELTGYPALSKCLLKLTLREKGLLPEPAWVKGLNGQITIRQLGLDPVAPLWESERTDFAECAFGDEDHLETSPRFGASTLKRQWVDPRITTRSTKG